MQRISLTIAPLGRKSIASLCANVHSKNAPSWQSRINTVNAGVGGAMFQLPNRMMTLQVRPQDFGVCKRGMSTSVAEEPEKERAKKIEVKDYSGKISLALTAGQYQEVGFPLEGGNKYALMTIVAILLGQWLSVYGVMKGYFLVILSQAGMGNFALISSVSLLGILYPLMWLHLLYLWMRPGGTPGLVKSRAPRLKGSPALVAFLITLVVGASLWPMWLLE